MRSYVIDASVLVAAAADGGSAGSWAEDLVDTSELVCPYLAPVEATSILRRLELTGELDRDSASLAHADLQEMDLTLFPSKPFANRIWQLRHNLTAYDAWYVALAEALSLPLATLDARLARASGPTCGFDLPC